MKSTNVLFIQIRNIKNCCSICCKTKHSLAYYTAVSMDSKASILMRFLPVMCVFDVEMCLINDLI